VRERWETDCHRKEAASELIEERQHAGKGIARQSGATGVGSVMAEIALPMSTYT
jgi:hypothetical protein